MSKAKAIFFAKPSFHEVIGFAAILWLFAMVWMR